MIKKGKKLVSEPMITVAETSDKTSYPSLTDRKAKVDHLQEKLEIDIIRDFNGISDNQKDIVLKMLDKNSSLRKMANLDPGYCEKKTDPYTNEGANEYDETDENGIFSLKYPVEDYELVGDLAVDKEVMGRAGGKKKKAAAINLRQKYGKLVNNKAKKAESYAAANQDLEKEALTAMRMVSSDLQKWVNNTLQNSILLDPNVMQQISEMEEKIPADPTKPKPPAIPEVDISGFNVLLNACKPAVLEARPPMKLNVVRETNQVQNIPTNPSESKAHRGAFKNPPRKIYGAWYLKIGDWKVKKENNGETNKKTLFGGIVQQKLDEITKKREIDMKALLKG